MVDLKQQHGPTPAGMGPQLPDDEVGAASSMQEDKSDAAISSSAEAEIGFEEFGPFIGASTQCFPHAVARAVFSAKKADREPSCAKHIASAIWGNPYAFSRRTFLELFSDSSASAATTRGSSERCHRASDGARTAERENPDPWAASRRWHPH
jgi:hypothetical protein